MPTIAITGIDTGVGKTLITGLFARHLRAAGHSVITQKLVQTGCAGMSEDILLHRRLMGIDLTDADRQGITCPYVFALPASPHLAASAEGRVIDLDCVTLATRQLEEQYEFVLLEGAGGLYVPLTGAATFLDYLAARRLPLIIVSSAKLGSINHTLLTLDVAHARHLSVLAVAYNLYPPEDPRIIEDSQRVFRQYLRRFGYPERVISVPAISADAPLPSPDFSGIFC